MNALLKISCGVSMRDRTSCTTLTIIKYSIYLCLNLFKIVHHITIPHREHEIKCTWRQLIKMKLKCNTTYWSSQNYSNIMRRQAKVYAFVRRRNHRDYRDLTI
jgi:hypothetical protein